MAMRMLAPALLAWVLWVDQTEYALSGGPSGGQIVSEGAQSRRQTLAVTDSRGQCEAAKQQAIRTGAGLEHTSPGKYRAEFRYFCVPAADLPGK